MLRKKDRCNESEKLNLEFVVKERCVSHPVNAMVRCYRRTEKVSLDNQKRDDRRYPYLPAMSGIVLARVYVGVNVECYTARRRKA